MQCRLHILDTHQISRWYSSTIDYLAFHSKVEYIQLTLKNTAHIIILKFDLIGYSEHK